MERNYWSRFTNQRIGRRRALAATGGAALGAAFLAACGGDDDDEVSAPAATTAPGATSAPAATAAPPGLITKPEETTPKPGGTFKDLVRAEPRSLDPISGQANLSTPATLT